MTITTFTGTVGGKAALKLLQPKYLAMHLQQEGYYRNPVQTETAEIEYWQYSSDSEESIDRSSDLVYQFGQLSPQKSYTLFLPPLTERQV